MTRGWRQRISPLQSHSPQAPSDAEVFTRKNSPNKISYEKNGCTDLIIGWLKDNVDDHIHLFLDLSQDATAEGRRLRTGKVSKFFHYCKITAAVCEDNPDEKDGFAADPDWYAGSIKNHLCRYVFYSFLSWSQHWPQVLLSLKQKYCKFNKALGQTGAGLWPDEILEGSEMHNLISKSIILLWTT